MSIEVKYKEPARQPVKEIQVADSAGDQLNIIPSNAGRLVLDINKDRAVYLSRDDACVLLPLLKNFVDTGRLEG